jgi:hypothetical protein
MFGICLQIDTTAFAISLLCRTRAGTFALATDLGAGAFVVAFAAVFGICLQIDALAATVCLAY